jgi:uncharacterized protein YPO0396
MGKEAALKVLRRQLRNVMKENIKETLNLELVANIRRELGEKVDVGIKTLNKVLTERLDAIEARAKDTQNLIMRESNASKPHDPSKALLVDMELGPKK